MTVAGTPTSQTIAQSTLSIIEGSATHNGSTAAVSFEFGLQSDTCRKIIQDISVYYEKCFTFCGSNLCPDDLPYYKLLGPNECVAKCPHGYKEDGNNCVVT